MRATACLAALTGLVLCLLPPTQNARAADPDDGAPHRISALIRQSVAATVPLDRLVDELLPDLTHLVLETPGPLMQVLDGMEVYRNRFQQLEERIRVLQAQALEHRDTLLFQCLAAQHRRAQELVAGSNRAYRDLLRGITEEDIDRTRSALEMAALFPRLARELNAAKNECVGTLPGIYVENLPHRKG